MLACALCSNANAGVQWDRCKYGVQILPGSSRLAAVQSSRLCVSCRLPVFSSSSTVPLSIGCCLQTAVSRITRLCRVHSLTCMLLLPSAAGSGGLEVSGFEIFESARMQACKEGRRCRGRRPGRGGLWSRYCPLRGQIEQLQSQKAEGSRQQAAGSRRGAFGMIGSGRFSWDGHGRQGCSGRCWGPVLGYRRLSRPYFQAREGPRGGEEAADSIWRGWAEESKQPNLRPHPLFFL
jgi:hypothetical protein